MNVVQWIDFLWKRLQGTERAECGLQARVTALESREAVTEKRMSKFDDDLAALDAREDALAKLVTQVAATVPALVQSNATQATQIADLKTQLAAALGNAAPNLTGLETTTAKIGADLQALTAALSAAPAS